MEKERYESYVSLLKKELIPALGCTEPIAIAYASAKASQVLNSVPSHIMAECSGNIVKNVMGVIVPNSDNNKGIEIAATLGAIAGDANAGLNVLEKVTEDQIEECKKLVASGFCKCVLAEGVDNLYVKITAHEGVSEAEVTVSHTHTNITRIAKDGIIIFEKPETERQKDNFYKTMSISEILDFAKEVRLSDVRDILKMQIKCNTAISNEGLTHSYGANIGKTVIKRGNADFSSRIKGKVAAGSDARMNGCSMPVVINSGSGNQGLAVSLPVIEFAKEKNLTEDELLRGLLVSNLV